MRALAAVLALIAAPAAAQTIVASPAPERVAVTVYRNPDRGLEPMNLQWLGGYALVSETRRVRLPAGESELRFEGVTAGIVPQSAIVTGLGPAVIEKNRDARLLSPGSLIAAHLGQRLTLRRTSKATGEVRRQEAIVRATDDGVVLQTADGIEALRCTGLNETLVAREVPPGLSAKPTLSVRVRSPAPIEQDVTLSYITNNFDWQADYVADLSPDGRTMRLLGWLTLANGDDTGLENASTQAVAGKLNREFVHVERGDAPPIQISCWPQGTTSDLPIPSPPPPPPPPATMLPPPPPSPERGGDEIVVTGSSIIAQQERLGEVRLYRIPIAVTVAARSQKQVALMLQPRVEVTPIYVLDFGVADHNHDQQARLVLRTRNSAAAGLGLPLPAGRIIFFRKAGNRKLLLGESELADTTLNEKVELEVAEIAGVLGRQIQDAGGSIRLTLTNDRALPAQVEVELTHADGARLKSDGRLVRRDGKTLWNVTVPANGRANLVYRVSEEG